MNISIIIPNYNGEEILKKNLPKVFEAVFSHRGGEVEIIIIDDCSTDNSIKEISYQISHIKNTYQKLMTSIKFFKNDKNLGFSSTINRGVNESNGDIAILLNTDVVPKKDFLQPLLRHFSDPLVFAVGCMDESVENGGVVSRGRGIGLWKRGFLVHSRGEVNKLNTLWVSGGSGAFRKNIWEKLGGLDSLYNPFYWEDIDLSYRALKSGYKIAFEPRSVVIHRHEKGAIKKRYSESEVKTIAYRNQFIFVWKNATDLELQFSHMLWLPYHFARALVSGDLNFLIGFCLAILRLPQVVISGFRAQKYFTKSDREVVEEFSK
ncbi:MAG: glycosyltransferase family 2 protein [Candidatus Levybacteria bacterium]|nr:glycosyltransferase family 2 protein [Candidatus Levybacteria bacterium]